MKRIYFIIAFAFSAILMQAQVELNGVELGVNYDGEQEINTSINGVEGDINVMRLNDGRVYQFFFAPKDNLRISETDVEKIVSWLEKEFEIIFEKPEKKNSPYSLIAFKDGVEFSTFNFHNIVLNSNRFNFFITNQKLGKIATKEIRKNQRNK